MSLNPKVVIASHRLPIKIANGEIISSDGGLVTTLNDAGIADESLWLGYLGDAKEIEYFGDIGENYLPIQMDTETHNHFYNGFCNQVLWPGLHSRCDLIDSEDRFWEAYQKVNELYCQNIIEQSDANTPVWIHDYHLMLLPKMLKRIQPQRRIGFFLHIPWPNFKIATQIPHLAELAEGIFKSDGICFQIPNYKRNFEQFVQEAVSSLSTFEKTNLRKKLHCTPVGIDCQKFSVQMDHSERTNFTKYQRIVGVDRFDYSKGIDFKLLSFHDFLELNPHLLGKISLHQLLIPTREDIAAYQEYKEEVLQLTRYINKKFQQPGWQPIELKIGFMSKDELQSFYRQGDVCFITSPADGMNLVSMEYLSAQDPNDPGVLLLSDKTGAAHFLSHSLQFEGGDLEGAVRGLFAAFRMPMTERQARWEADMEWIRSNSARKYSLKNLEILGVKVPDRMDSAEPSQEQFNSAI